MAYCLSRVPDGERVALNKAVIFIGRHADCDLVLEDSRKVSRKHCCIAMVNDSFIVRDLGSMNGVRINGVRIEEETPLDIGDEVTFGDVHYILEAVDSVDREPKEAAPPIIDESPAEPPVEQPVKPSPAFVAPKIPVNLSQKFPVAIDEEEGEEFAVEPSLNLPPGNSPIFDDDAEFPILDDENREENDVVMLEDSGEQRDSGSQS